MSQYPFSNISGGDRSTRILVHITIVTLLPLSGSEGFAHPIVQISLLASVEFIRDSSRLIRYRYYTSHPPAQRGIGILNEQHAHFEKK